jgi:aryl-alcohol dehydrogenase-like predicted oxidoreductase
MKTRELGTLEVAEIGFGTMSFAATYGEAPDRSRFPRFTREALEANQAIVALEQRLAEAKGATPAQIALAWLFARRPWIVPIPGTRRLERVSENVGAAEVVMTPGELAEIETACARIEVKGARLPEAILQFSYR